jgi:hypothetical protein
MANTENSSSTTESRSKALSIYRRSSRNRVINRSKTQFMIWLELLTIRVILIMDTTQPSVEILEIKNGTHSMIPRFMKVERKAHFKVPTLIYSFSPKSKFVD